MFIPWKADSFTRARLIRILTILLIVMFLFTSLLSFAITRQAIDSNMRTRDLPLISENVYASFEKKLVHSTVNVIFMANDAFLIDWAISGEENVNAVQSYLKNIRDKYGYTSAFYISDATQNYYNQDGLLRKIDPRNEQDAWFRNLRGVNKDYVLHINRSKVVEESLSVTIAHRVKNQAGKYIGIAGISMDFTSAINTLRVFQATHNCYIYLINSGGLIEMHANPSLEGITHISEMEGMGDHSYEILSSQKGSFLFHYRSSDQREMEVSSQYYPDLDWYLVIEQDQTVDLAEARKTLLRDIILYLLTTAAIGSLVIFTVYLFQSKLEAQAIVDELTGLFNRRRFNHLFQREIAYAQRYEQPLSLLMVDIDNFKKVNDQFGHLAGDRVLKNVAEVMLKEVRAVDVVGRWGGEEFVILLHKTDMQQAFATAERLREAIAATEIDIGKKSINATISIGIASADFCNLDMEEMIMQADQAMYRAKQTGRNRTCTAEPPTSQSNVTANTPTPPPCPKAES